MALTLSPVELVAAAERSGSPALLARHETWERVPLGEIADVLNGFPFKSHAFNHDNDGIPLIRIRDVGRDASQTYYSGDYESQYLVQAGDMILGMDGDFRVAIWQGPTALLNQRVCKISIRNPENYDPRFLLYVLPGYLDVIGDATSSVTVKHLSSRSIQQIPLPLPPLSEQIRIVEALDDRLSRLDSSCAVLRHSLSRMAGLRRAMVRRALQGEGISLPREGDAVEEFQPRSQLATESEPWKIPDEWIWTRIGSLFDVYVGSTPSRKSPELWTGDIPWVSSGEVSFGRISQTRECISENAISNRNTRLHPPGTVMIAMIGEGKTRGQAAILDIEAAHNQNCASIRVSETRVLPEYIYLVLEERYQQSRQSSSGGNQPALNKSKVEAIPVPLPPLVVQKWIVAQIGEFSAVSNRICTELERTLKRASHLRKAILSQAFMGQLASQDSAGEPASVLLDRIRAEREVKGGKSKRAVRGPRKVAAPEEIFPPPASSNPLPTNSVQQELPL